MTEIYDDREYSSGFEQPMQGYVDSSDVSNDYDSDESEIEISEPSQEITLPKQTSKKRRITELQRPAMASNNAGNRTRARAWCFTLNNPLITGPAFLDFLRAAPGVRAVVFQLEMGNEGGTQHYQGYIQFESPIGFKRLKDLMPQAHIEKANGTAEQNHIYCTKNETRLDGPWEFGEFKNERQRSDIYKVAVMLKNGSTTKAVMEEYPDVALRYASAISKFKRDCPPPPLERSLKVWLFIGPTGTGKTHSAVRKAFTPGGELNEECYLKNPDEWFDGYAGQDIAILDDFGGAASKLSLIWLLRLLDKYRMMVPVKGAFEWWIPTTIVVTTNIHPYLWYKIAHRMESYRALIRRFSGIRLYSGSTEFGSFTEMNSIEERNEFFMDPVKYGYSDVRTED